MILADLHVHSSYSDGQLSIPDVVNFYGARGFGAIAITDHLCESSTFLGKAARYLDCTLTPENFPHYLEILKNEAERAWDQFRMVVLPGFELSKNNILNSRSAHIVGIGINQFVPADADIPELARAIRNQGGLAIAAHPVHTRKLEKQTYHLWDRRKELAEEFDAWEVASGPHLFDEVLRSGLPMIATSDFHRPAQINSYKTWIDSERHPEAILDAIRAQKVSFQMYQEDHGNEPRESSPSFCLDSLTHNRELRNLLNPAAAASRRLSAI